jgi:hypothetical protein
MQISKKIFLEWLFLPRTFTWKVHSILEYLIFLVYSVQDVCSTSYIKINGYKSNEINQKHYISGYSGFTVICDSVGRFSSSAEEGFLWSAFTSPISSSIFAFV